MSVPAAPNFVTHTGNGATTTWPYTFNIKNSSSVTVTLYDSVTNTETILTVDTQYTVSAYDNDAGGNVTYPLSGTPIASTKKITIRSTPPIAQTYEPGPQGGFSPASLEEQLDRMTLMMQELDRLADQALTVPQGETSTPAALVQALINFLEGVTSTLNLAQTLIPAAHNTYDLGSAAVRWRDGFYQNNVRVATAANTNSDDVVTRGATQTLSSKTLADPVVTATALLTETSSLVGVVMKQMVSTNPGVNGTGLEFYHNSASPANADNPHLLEFSANSNTGTKRALYRIQTRYDDITNASEDASVFHYVISAGTLAAILYLGANAAGTADASKVALPLGMLSMPAVQNPSAGANVWDDYEEGTATPNVGGTATYTAQAGAYTKNGRNINYSFQLRINVIGTGSTSLISGNPFTSTGVLIAGHVGFWNSAVASFVFISGLVTAAATTIQLYSATAAASGLSINAVYGNGTDSYGNFNYTV